MRLTQEQVDSFRQDGFLILENLLGSPILSCIDTAMTRVYNGTYNRDIRPAAVRSAVTPFGTQSSVHWILNARLVDGDLWETATDPELGRAAAQLLETEDVSVIEDQLLDKPGRGAPVNLHQDYSYWRFSTSTNMLTCWIPLCDLTIDMGPVEVVRGSHHWGFAPRPRELIHGSAEEYLSAAEPVIPKGARLDFVPALVPKGGAIFFHGLTFHGSRGNLSDRVRRAMSLHWAAADCRLDRAQLVDYDHPYLFTGLGHGDRLANKYIPRVDLGAWP